MNSWNKHVPKLVFAIGILFLGYSMITFFRAPSDRPAIAIKPHTPPRAGSEIVPPKPADPKYYARTWKAPPPTIAHHNALENARLAAQNGAAFRLQPAKAYLKRSGLRMYLSEDLVYNEAKNEGMDILIGTRGSKTDFFLISGKAKLTPAQAKAEMVDQFEGDYGLKNIQSNITKNKNGVGPITQFKGETRSGEEFQAYYFYNAKNGSSHMLFMADKDLSRQPARTRQLFDSLEYDR